MKVCLVVNEMNIRGGTHKQILRLAQYLERKRISFQWLTREFDINKTYPECRDFSIIQLTGGVRKKKKSDTLIGRVLFKFYNLFYDLWDQYSLFKKMEKDVDLVNVHDNELSFFMILVLLHNKKLIWQINDMPGCFCVGAQQGSNVGRIHRVINAIKKKIYSEIANHIDLITVNVTKNKRLVKEHLNKDAVVLYCGTDVVASTGIHECIKNKKCVHLISTGVFFRYRNYETQVCVVEKILNNGYNCHLDIIGSTELDPQYADDIQKLIQECNLCDNISIHGQVDEEKFNSLYDNADIFLFININQSWGLAVFEAMARGMPVIVSDSVGAVELLHDGEDSIIVDPLDSTVITQKIIDLYDDAIYEKISRTAHFNASQYTWDKLYSSKMVEAFYQVERSPQIQNG